MCKLTFPANVPCVRLAETRGHSLLSQNMGAAGHTGGQSKTCEGITVPMLPHPASVSAESLCTKRRDRHPTSGHHTPICRTFILGLGIPPYLLDSFHGPREGVPVIPILQVSKLRRRTKKQPKPVHTGPRRGLAGSSRRTAAVTRGPFSRPGASARRLLHVLLKLFS